jgi:hypothetical protein
MDPRPLEEVEGLHVVRSHHALLADEVAGSFFRPRNNSREINGFVIDYKNCQIGIK